MLVEVSDPDLVTFGLQTAQGFGLITPIASAGQNLAGFAAKIRSALLTDNNTKLRPLHRILLSYLLARNEVFTVDPTLLLLCAIKLSITDVLSSIAYAEMNKMCIAESAPKEENNGTQTAEPTGRSTAS